MGRGTYSMMCRSVRATTDGYYSKPMDEIFTQNKAHVIHEAMRTQNVKIRESCDSVEHPNTTPIQLYLDDTGSMGRIPHEMIKDGLPTLVGKLIQNGVPDVALLFGAVGDHECDRFPLQIGQFESGDAELDMWLTRTYIEGNGGGNAGESYLLAWYFAAFHTKTDAFDKRGQKGFVFTVGDEPCLKVLPLSALKDIMGDAAVGQGSYTREELLEKAQEKNHVFHVHIKHGCRDIDPAWKEMLGDNLIVIDDYRELSNIISDTILSTLKISTTPLPPSSENSWDGIKEDSKEDTEIIL